MKVERIPGVEMEQRFVKSDDPNEPDYIEIVLHYTSRHKAFWYLVPKYLEIKWWQWPLVLKGYIKWMLFYKKQEG